LHKKLKADIVKILLIHEGHQLREQKEHYNTAINKRLNININKLASKRTDIVLVYTAWLNIHAQSTQEEIGDKDI
jgi:hypothetical protein